MNAYQSKLIMYYEIQRMSREGFSVSKICRELVLDWRTVRNYLAMSEAEFDGFAAGQTERSKVLLAYEGFVKSKLLLHQDTSATNYTTGSKNTTRIFLQYRLKLYSILWYGISQMPSVI